MITTSSLRYHPVTIPEYRRELAELTREAYPPTGPIPWYRLLIAEPVWPAQATSDGTWYQKIMVYSLRAAPASVYQAVHQWYVDEAKTTFPNELARDDAEVYPMPRASELLPRSIYGGPIRIDWTGWEEHFEARMIVAYRANELSDDDEAVLVNHLVGTPDEQTVLRAHGVCAGIQCLMPPAWCSRTFKVFDIE